MKRLIILQTVVLIPSLVVAVSAAAQGVRPQSSAGPYFGQPLPGERPEVFAPGLISESGDRLHGPVTFSPNGAVVCWSVLPPAVTCSHQREDGSWSAPAAVPLPVRGVSAAQFDPEGRLWFQGVPETGGAGSLDVGFVSWSGAEWSDPTWPPTPINTEGMNATPSCTAAGDVFLTGGRPGKVWNRGLFHVPFVDGRYGPRVYLPEPVNAGPEAIDYTVFVDPDGRFLIWASSRPSGEEENLRLYISHRGEKGRWSEPVSLSSRLGLSHAARFPSLSPDGRFLFFLMSGKIWWVDATPHLQPRSESSMPGP